MGESALLWPMAGHLLWVVLLYAVLTLARAPAVWGLGSGSGWGRRLATVEPRVSANLSNQFEWPLFFHLACLLLIVRGDAIDTLTLGLAWGFLLGRSAHSFVQILSGNLRWRGLVFMVNFLAVMGLWGTLLA